MRPFQFYCIRDTHSCFNGSLYIMSYNIYIIYGFFFNAGPNLVIDSRSCCNRFLANQFLFSHQMVKIPFVTHSRRNKSNTVKKKKKKSSFLLAKYIPVSHKNGSQKQEWRYPTACVGSYFIADKNIQTYLTCLQSCNMQKHQKANFRTAQNVCVEQ